MHSDDKVSEITYDRRRLESLKNVAVETQDLFSQCRVAVQESQELLRQVDELLMRSRIKVGSAEI